MIDILSKYNTEIPDNAPITQNYPYSLDSDYIFDKNKSSAFNKFLKINDLDKNDYTGEEFYAFLDIAPMAKGHTLVIPKNVEDDYIFNLDDNTYMGLCAFAKKVAQALKAAVPCQRVGVAVLGMEVPHTHIHLVPLQTEGDMDFRKKKLELSQEEFAEIASSIYNEYVKIQ